jgi:hypothetical protein
MSKPFAWGIDSSQRWTPARWSRPVSRLISFDTLTTVTAALTAGLAIDLPLVGLLVILPDGRAPSPFSRTWRAWSDLGGFRQRIWRVRGGRYRPSLLRQIRSAAVIARVPAAVGYGIFAF